MSSARQDLTNYLQHDRIKETPRGVPKAPMQRTAVSTSAKEVHTYGYIF